MGLIGKNDKQQMRELILPLASAIHNAESIAVLTGAGMSTASGIPDFRSASGVYSDDENVNVFDLDAFHRDPLLYYRFANWFYPIVQKAEPNAAHFALVDWQKMGKMVTVITQNVDDCHQRAGSTPVYTLHGNYQQSRCTRCRTVVNTDTLMADIMEGKVPYCSCGGVFKPEITFFGEGLPEHDWNEAIRAVSRADLVLVLGSSLVVYPAASIPGYRRQGTKMAIINRDSTPLDHKANFVIHDDLCEVMTAISEELKKMTAAN